MTRSIAIVFLALVFLGPVGRTASAQGIPNADYAVNAILIGDGIGGHQLRRVSRWDQPELKILLLATPDASRKGVNEIYDQFHFFLSSLPKAVNVCIAYLPTIDADRERCRFGTADIVFFMAHESADMEIEKLTSEGLALFSREQQFPSGEFAQLIKRLREGHRCGYAGNLVPGTSALAEVVAVDAEANEFSAWQACGWRLVARSLGVPPARNIDDVNARMLWLDLFRFLYSDLVRSGMNESELRKAAEAWIEREKKEPHATVTFP